MADTDAAVAAIDRAAAALADARQIIAAAPGETVPPTTQPPGRLQPLNVTATGIPGGVTLTWANSAEAAGYPVFVAWGATTFLGKTTAAAGSTTLTVNELQPGAAHDFDVGYMTPTGVDAAALVRVRATPLPVVLQPSDPPTVPLPPSSPDLVYPSGSTWPARRQFIIAHAGVGTVPLKRIASQADLTANGLPGQWSGGDGGQWNCPAGGPYETLDIRGMLYYTGPGPLTMKRCRVMGVRYASTSGKSGGSFQHCTVIPQPGMPLGQGGVNFWGQTGWSVESCDISGFADGFQCVGPGRIIDTWVHDLAYGTTPSGIVTHNDGCQNYGGQVTLDRCVFDMGGVAGSTNGALFCSEPSASFSATELFVDVTRSDVNALHAWASPVGITVNGGRVSKLGRLIGKVTLIGVTRD